VVDLRTLYQERKAALLSPPLYNAINAALERGEQAILFLNRRAYAPFVVCRDCGYRFVCLHCSVALCLHRSDNSLRCHQCDYRIPLPEMCPQCSGTRVGAFGVGVEKVEEAVQLHWPEAKVARLDRDIAKRKGALEEVMAQFRSGEINVLVGTQMVAKGLDFPNVTVVGVIAADISLNIPDFRASERTFQLLSQVAGRAGRGSKPGRVVIQTLSPEHVSVVTAQNHDFEALFKVVSEERREAEYPPFVRLVNILFVGKNRASVVEASAVAAQRLKVALAQAEVKGPVDCAISRIQDNFRRHILVKLPPGTPASVCARPLEGLDSSRVRVMVDVDPYNLI
ncbi:MAG: primosomal protein N', partial [Armatimonadota bacterium]